MLHRQKPLHAKSASHQVFQIFAAACQHFMTKSIGAYRIVIFADKSSFIIMNAFGNADNNITVFFEAGFCFFQKFFCIKGCFRKINKKRVIAVYLRARALAAVSHPA